jgi:hypothetical protein
MNTKLFLIAVAIVAAFSIAAVNVNVGKLKANNGNQNYDIPAATDLSKYDTILIWCRPFSVLFGSAELNSVI